MSIKPSGNSSGTIKVLPGTEMYCSAYGSNSLGGSITVNQTQVAYSPYSGEGRGTHSHTILNNINVDVSIYYGNFNVGIISITDESPEKVSVKLVYEDSSSISSVTHSELGSIGEGTFEVSVGSSFTFNLEQTNGYRIYNFDTTVRRNNTCTTCAVKVGVSKASTITINAPQNSSGKIYITQ